jgi:hypothetical protein
MIKWLFAPFDKNLKVETLSSNKIFHVYCKHMGYRVWKGANTHAYIVYSQIWFENQWKCQPTFFLLK